MKREVFAQMCQGMADPAKNHSSYSKMTLSTCGLPSAPQDILWLSDVVWPAHRK